MSHVLLVDDTPEIAELLTFALRDQGFEVTATGFTAGISELLGQVRADALVLDCSALEMSETLFDSARIDHPDLPVVIISDTPEVADQRLKQRSARRVLLVPKPFTGSQVVAALQRLLE